MYTFDAVHPPETQAKETPMHTPAPTPEPVRFLSSGFPELDRILGGGYAVGRIVELIAADRTMLHALTFAAIGRVQALEVSVAAFIDVTHEIDLAHAAKAGVDCASLLVSQPDTLADSLEIAETLVRSGAVDLVAIGPIGDINPDAHLQVSQALRRVCIAAYHSGCTVLVFTSPKSMTAVKYYATQRADFHRCDSFVRARVLKNKIAQPFQTCELAL